MRILESNQIMPERIICPECKYIAIYKFIDKEAQEYECYVYHCEKCEEYFYVSSVWRWS